MRKASTFSHQTVIPRMSWSPKNLYNLIARSTVPFHAQATDLTKTSKTIYQQRWRSKRLLRGYHGDWIQENRFKRWFLPNNLPNFQNEISQNSAVRARDSLSGAAAAKSRGGQEVKLPIASLFVRDVERRLDTAVFRACFVRSAYEARRLIVHGKVTLNGVKQTNPNTLLSPSDLISVEPSSIPMLSQELATRSAKQKARLEKAREISKARNKAHSGPQKGTEAQGQVGEANISGEELKVEESKIGEIESSSSEGEEAAASSSTATEAPPEQVESKVTANPDSTTASSKDPKPSKSDLPEGVLPFNLPPFATPFLFIPPFLEVSFKTCSFIYLRHPTILTLPPSDSHTNSNSTSIITNQETSSSSSNSLSEISRTKSLSYRTDLPSPYDPASEMFSLASEHYSRNAPRVRGDLRRERDEARVGRNGFISARAKDSWRRKRAVRKGWARGVVQGLGRGIRKEPVRI